MKNNPLLDKDFLKELDQNTQRVLYAKIISLNINEEPLESIEGKVKAGTINIDGSSAIRRNCSLTMVSDEVNINDVYWGLTNKFKLYIGVVNDINPDYEDIIWFPQGIFVINSFNISFTTKQYQITVKGQDKMCLLNGSVGGNLPVAVDFASEDITDEDGITVREFRPIKYIIRELIHYYGNEPFHNIVINDVDDFGLEQLDYVGQSDIYIFRTVDGEFTNMLFDGDEIRYERDSGRPIQINDSTQMVYYSLTKDNIYNGMATWIKDSPDDDSSNSYQVVKCLPGEAAGYRIMDLIWPEKDGLIGKVGETITSILDKICKTFTEYEYFYDIEGRFVFQKKLTYVNTSWNNIIKVEDDESYIESDKLCSQITYNFANSFLVQSFTNSPEFKDLKNDFSIWGKKKTSNNSSSSSSKSATDPHAIHLRYAIHEKPSEYIDYNGVKWIAGTATYKTINDEEKNTIVDWRELLYRMAVDYLAHNHDDDFAIQIARKNPQYPFGTTGYEQYYEDMLKFWRMLYDPFSSDSNTYFVGGQIGEKEQSYGWNQMVKEDPSALKFWIDFLDPQGGELSQYSVSAIGSRTKAVNQDNIKAITYKEIPTLIYITPQKYAEYEDNNQLVSGYTYVKMPESFEAYFQRSTQSKTAQQELDNLLYKHTYLNQKITIKNVPVYYLNPNTKITVDDESSNIHGEYIINKITLPLDYKGQMSIQASKAPIRLY